MPTRVKKSRQAIQEGTLIAPRFLFRWSVEVPYSKSVWPLAKEPSMPRLDESHQLLALGQLDGERQFADVRMAWTPLGLLWTVQIDGKTERPWCRESRLDDSDGLQVWVDTRATTDIHRASRFCHRFVFLPAGGGPKADRPVADQLLINRARENAQPIRPRQLQVRSQVTSEGYKMVAFVPAEALGGYDSQQAPEPPRQEKNTKSPEGSRPNRPKLGFTYAIRDQQLGLQTFATGPEFPYEEDPSCWAEVELV
jgi:hypothetical protein